MPLFCCFELGGNSIVYQIAGLDKLRNAEIISHLQPQSFHMLQTEQHYLAQDGSCVEGVRRLEPLRLQLSGEKPFRIRHLWPVVTGFDRRLITEFPVRQFESKGGPDSLRKILTIW